MRISDYLQKEELGITAGVEIEAAVREHFDDVAGGHKCKLCGEVVKHPYAARAHMGRHHRKELEK